MVELTVKGKEKNDDKSIEEELGSAGVHFYIDGIYQSRMENIQNELTGLLSDDDIDSMKLSAIKTQLMKQVQKRLRYTWFHVPSGKAIEKPLFARKMQAARRILHRAREDILCDASDEDVDLVVSDSLAKMDTLVGFTFDTPNTSIQKSFTVHGLPGGGNNGPWLDEDVKKMLIERKREENAQRKP